VNDDWDALKQRVKEASDIVDVVGGYVPLQPRHGTFKGLCPFHDDHNASFDVDPRRQRYRCWACSKIGDVFSFVMEHERVDFREALELLARRAGISLEKVSKKQSGPDRGAMLDVLRWAQEQFARNLLDDPGAEPARAYLTERGLAWETVEAWGLGYAPNSFEWLTARGVNEGRAPDLMEAVGLVARKTEGRGCYDRFRDRVIFPIRDPRGHVVGFGGRVLPSQAEQTGPKYYNTSETPVFSKKTLLYGLDQAQKEAAKTGTLAIVEGYMDVLMAHQHGIRNVVAPMGTALTADHLRKLRGLAQKIVLVFDADKGGSTGVDRALELFVGQKIDLRIGVPPEGLDPCDVLVKHGPDSMAKILDGAVDVFEFKLKQVWPKAGNLEQKRVALDKMLTVLAAAPELGGAKMEMMVNRVATMLVVKEETLWKQLRELHRDRQARSRQQTARMEAAAATEVEQPEPEEAEPEPEHIVSGSGPAASHERELIEVLLAEPNLVCRAMQEIPADTIEHPGLRRVLVALYGLQAGGRTPDLDRLREQLDNEKLLQKVFELQDRGLNHRDRNVAYEQIVGRFREVERRRFHSNLMAEMESLTDPAAKIELLAKLKTSQTQGGSKDTPRLPGTATGSNGESPQSPKDQ
jgi:DNA primase